MRYLHSAIQHAIRKCKAKDMYVIYSLMYNCHTNLFTQINTIEKNRSVVFPLI